MRRRHILAALPILPALLALPAQAGYFEKKLVIHVGKNDMAEMQNALVVARNVSEHFSGEDVKIKIIAISGGINMFIAGESMYETAMERLKRDFPKVDFLVCGNSLKGAAKQLDIPVDEIELLPDVEVVETGVAAIMQLEADGYAYYRP